MADFVFDQTGCSVFHGSEALLLHSPAQRSPRWGAHASASVHAAKQTMSLAESAPTHHLPLPRTHARTRAQVHAHPKASSPLRTRLAVTRHRPGRGRVREYFSFVWLVGLRRCGRVCEARLHRRVLRDRAATGNAAGARLRAQGPGHCTRARTAEGLRRVRQIGPAVRFIVVLHNSDDSLGRSLLRIAFRSTTPRGLSPRGLAPSTAFQHSSSRAALRPPHLPCLCVAAATQMMRCSIGIFGPNGTRPGRRASLHPVAHDEPGGERALGAFGRTVVCYRGRSLSVCTRPTTASSTRW
jgi:hypothetical protein